jgi:hypothetical protein
MPKQSLCRVSASLPSASTGQSHTPPSHLNKSWSTSPPLPLFYFICSDLNAGPFPSTIVVLIFFGLSITIFYATELDCHIRITLIHSVQYTGTDSGFLLLSFACCGSFTHIYMAFCTTHIIMISIGFTHHFNSIATYTASMVRRIPSRNLTNASNTNDKNLCCIMVTPSHTATENSAIYT